MSHDTEFIRPITTSQEIEQAEEILSWVVRYSNPKTKPFEVTLFKQEGWVAVPVQKYSHIVLMNQEQLQQVVLAHGYTEMVSVALDVWGYSPTIYAVPTTVEGIEEFNRLWSPFTCALFAGKPDWVIIFVDDVFDVVAGTVDFIRQLLGCEIEEGFTRFSDFMASYHLLVESYKEHLVLVHNNLQNNYPSAEVGAEFQLMYSQR